MTQGPAWSCDEAHPSGGSSVMGDNTPSAECRRPEDFPGRLGASRALRAGLAILLLGPATLSLAQQAERPAGGGRDESLSRIISDYQQQRARLDRERIGRLTRLAES